MTETDHPTDSSSAVNEEPAPTSTDRPSPRKQEPQKRGHRLQIARQVLLLLVLLYLFFLSISLMSGAFKMFATSAGYKETFDGWIAVTAHPLVGLALGILMTAVLQSSSTTTSMIVAAVAAGQLPIHYAIPMVMGANIGTTVTSTFVALVHVTRRQEFGRAFAAATVHDFFNLMAVAILLPLERLTGFFEKSAPGLTYLFQDVGQVEKTGSPLKAILKPVVKQITHLLETIPGELTPFLQLACALILLLVVLKYLSNNLRAVISGPVEKLVNDYLFAKAWRALLLGIIITALVQSSSISTSIAVPMVAGGIFTLRQIFPFLLGANIGTTITALLAALSLLGLNKGVDALNVAMVHLLFNVTGTALFIWSPACKLPIYLAEKLSYVAIHFRLLALVYVVTVFYIVPLLILFLFMS